jgi:predicted DNA-binding transcriptional regulator YafY
VLSFGESAEVLSPDEMRQAVTDRVEDALGQVK